ncbi:MAG: TIGR03936 family radical SAM-associated protein [Candidatus Omnitrophota bacterium]
MSYKYSFVLSKGDDMIYISHLDLMRLLSRAARRAGLKIELSKGFSPHFKIKMKKALKLGVASNNEEGELSLLEPMEAVQIASRWAKELPEGVQIKSVIAL